jgi:hypothetical protein
VVGVWPCFGGFIDCDEFGCLSKVLIHKKKKDLNLLLKCFIVSIKCNATRGFVKLY